MPWSIATPRRACSPAATSRRAPRLALQPRAGGRASGGSAAAGPAGSAASWISATSRSSASCRLRSWVRKRCALITRTPSWVSRRPASRSSRSGPLRQGGRAADVEPQLDRGLHLVDVLPAGSGRTHEAHLELALVQRDIRRDLDHARHPSRSRGRRSLRDRGPRDSWSTRSARGRPRTAAKQWGRSHDHPHRRHRPRFRGRHHPGPDPLPRMDRRRLGGPVLASQGLHAGLHHRARLHGQDQARVRQARREDHRHQRRPGRGPSSLGQGHRGDPGPRPELPDDRRPRAQDRQALRHAAGRRRRQLRPAARPPTTPPCATCS